jgi:hypothetical protein
MLFQFTIANKRKYKLFGGGGAATIRGIKPIPQWFFKVLDSIEEDDLGHPGDPNTPDYQQSLKIRGHALRQVPWVCRYTADQIYRTRR